LERKIFGLLIWSLKFFGFVENREPNNLSSLEIMETDDMEINDEGIDDGATGDEETDNEENDEDNQ